MKFLCLGWRLEIRPIHYFEMRPTALGGREPGMTGLHTSAALSTRPKGTP